MNSHLDILLRSTADLKPNLGYVARPPAAGFPAVTVMTWMDIAVSLNTEAWKRKYKLVR